MESAIHVSYPEDGVAVILQNTGPRNFSTFAANEQLAGALQEARSRDTRVVVVGSDVDGHFAGHGWLPDILEVFTGGTPSGDAFAGWQSFVELDSGPMVSIAAVDGAAWGHGAELAWACDLRVASRAATFGQPEVAIGAIPGSGGTVRLPRLVGESVALGLILDGRPISAEDAHRIGLVHRLVEPGTALASAVEWAAWLAGHPQGALARCKQVMKKARNEPVKEALRAEGAAFIEAVSMPDTLERIREVQRRYDEGTDTLDAFGLNR